MKSRKCGKLKGKGAGSCQKNGLADLLHIYVVVGDVYQYLRKYWTNSVMHTHQKNAMTFSFSRNSLIQAMRGHARPCQAIAKPFETIAKPKK